MRVSSFANAEYSPKKTGWTAAVELDAGPRRRDAETGRAALLRPGRVAEESGRDEPARRDGELAEHPADERRRVDSLHDPAADRDVRRAGRGRCLKATKYVERRGLSRYPEAKRGSWRSSSASAGRRSEATESRPARNSLLISSGENAEPEDEALRLRKAFAPVARIPLESRAACPARSGRRGRDRCRRIPGSSGPRGGWSPPARPRGRRTRAWPGRTTPAFPARGRTRRERRSSGPRARSTCRSGAPTPRGWAREATGSGSSRSGAFARRSSGRRAP